MRPLEIIIPLLLAFYLAWKHPRPLVIRALPALAILLTLIHFPLEGYRWQMIPLYSLTSILGLTSLLKIRSPLDWKPLASFLSLILLAVSTALPILLPVPSIPAPSGPYQVGTHIYELTDTSRKEVYSGKDEARRFMIQIWYPSGPSTSDSRAPWMSNARIFAPAIADHIGMPSFFLDHLALVKIPAYQDSKVAPSDTAFPVILFSHGWQGFNAQNTGQALQLASQGYIVIGIQHTYGAVVTVFPDGTVAGNNPAALPPDDTPIDQYEKTAQILVHQWAGDLGYTLDFMQKQNDDASSPFFHSLYLSRVGVYGHSTGGGAAIEFCGMDVRCTSLFGQDPFMRPVSYAVLDKGVTQPAFFMFSQRWHDDTTSRNNELFDKFYPHVINSLGAVYIEGTAHYDFTDLPLLSPLAPQLGLKGPINDTVVTAINNDYLIHFFDATLKNGSTSFFGNPSQYAEVKPRK
jgi:predicted dienelactone hydrolase